MYLDFFGLEENPFNVTSDPDFLYIGRTHREAMEHMLYGINERKGFVSLTGEIGSGKTTVCKALLEQLDEDYTRTSFILNPDLPKIQLLQAILKDFGLEPESENKFFLVNQLNEFLLNELSYGNNSVLILDEAQNIPVPTLEAIRLLSNLETQKEKLLQIVLVGQPGLKYKLNSPELSQLKQRLSVRCHLRALNDKEVPHYIKHRLRVAGETGKVFFKRRSLDLIVEFSKGLPRLINLVCDRSLQRAYAKKTFHISGEIVASSIEALEKADFTHPAPQERNDDLEKEQGPRQKTEAFNDEIAAEKTKRTSQPESSSTKQTHFCDFCGKNISEDLWYYRNGLFYCNKNCFKRREQAYKSGTAPHFN